MKLGTVRRGVMPETRGATLSSKKPLVDKRNRGPFLFALVVFTLTSIGTILVVLFLVGAFD